jgi:hypothetical protein
MANIFKSIGIADNERLFSATAGQDVIYTVAMDYIRNHREGLDAAIAVFVEQVTSNFKERYKLPGGGRLQRLGDEARPAVAQAFGYWDVAYPLMGLGSGIAGNRVGLAYMTAEEFSLHLENITIQDTNTVRFALLYRLFNNTATPFTDPIHGSLTIQPLANGDSVEYPPVLGAEDQATDNHYIEIGYASASISDTNNPLETVRDELTEHFGEMSGGEDIVVFINKAERAPVEALTDFDPTPDRYVVVGDDVDVPRDPAANAPGIFLGRCSGVTVKQWNWIPAGYLLGVHTDARPPLKMRIDPADTGLGQGLQMVSTFEDYPLREWNWEHRFGFGCGNRLNGVVIELDDAGTYTIPAAYDV